MIILYVAKFEQAVISKYPRPQLFSIIDFHCISQCVIEVCYHNTCCRPCIIILFVDYSSIIYCAVEQYYLVITITLYSINPNSVVHVGLMFSNCIVAIPGLFSSTLSFDRSPCPPTARFAFPSFLLCRIPFSDYLCPSIVRQSCSSLYLYRCSEFCPAY